LKLFIEHLNLVVANSMKNGNTREKLLDHILKGFEVYIPIFHILMDYSEILFEKNLQKIPSSDAIIQPTVRDLEAYFFNEVRKTSLKRMVEIVTVERKEVTSEGESSDDEQDREINKYNSLMNMFCNMPLSGFTEDDSEADEEKEKIIVGDLRTIEDDDEWDDEKVAFTGSMLTSQQQIAKQVCKMEYAREKPKISPVINTFEDPDEKEDGWE
jgi:hypothetical protein